MNTKKSRRLDSLVELSPGFKTAVNLKGDVNDDSKVAAFIPTENASDVLLDLAENLHPLKNRRSRILTGTYGTGKSHLAIVLARLYRDGTSDDALQPVLKKLKNTWPGKYQKIMQERDETKGKFLLVLLEGDEGSFDSSLMRRLDHVLRENELDDLLPETVFDAAIKRVAEIKEKDKDAFKRLDKVVADYGFQNIKALEERLRRKDKDTYSKFMGIHQALFAGAPFVSHAYMQPKEFFEAVSKRLVDERGYAGIVVIWDEFGRYMERIVDDPRSAEGQSIQSFADGCCNRSGNKQIHLYLICHRSLQEYVNLATLGRGAGMSKPHQEEWTKIVGRFREFTMHSTDREVFDLIDQVVIKRETDPAWSEFLAGARDYFDEWTHQATKLKLFNEFNEKELFRKVTLGAYPLHPMAAYCLPLISQRVAQNERTLFTFLSDTGSDTLGPFLHETDVPTTGSEPPCFTADRLWDFFGQDASRGQTEQKQIFKKWTQADSQVSADDEFEKRILKTVALLQIIKTDRAPCKEDMICFCLGLQQSRVADLREALKELSSRKDDRERILIQNLDGSYRFTGASGVGIVEKIEKAVENRATYFSPLKALKDIKPDLQVRQEIQATRYSDDHMLKRALRVQFTNLAELQSVDKCREFSGELDFRDGTAVIILCEDSSEIEKARGFAVSELKHPQIMVGIPKAPVRFIYLLRICDALKYLEETQANLYGEGADLRDEWEQQKGDHLNALRKEIEPLTEADSGTVTWFVDGIEHDDIRTTSKLSESVSKMMDKVFPLTPIIRHERLTTEEGKDNFVACRKAIIDKLLLPDGPKALANETRSQDKSVIEAVYRGTGILHQSPSGWAIDQPEASHSNEMHKVWEAVNQALQQAQSKELPASTLISLLRKPPYGLRIRTIPLLVAAVFRKYILRGNLSLKDALGLSIPIIDSNIIEKLTLIPEQYILTYTEISESQVDCLQGVAAAFGIDSSKDMSGARLIQATQKAITDWWVGLPPYAQTTHDLSQEALLVRESVLKAISSESTDSRKILLEALPSLVKDKEGHPIKIRMSAWKEKLQKIKGEIEQSVQGQLIKKVKDAIDEVFEQSGGIKKWWNSLDDVRKQTRLPGDPMLLVHTVQAITTGKISPEEAATKLAKEMTGTSLDNWNDRNVDVFKGRLDGAKRQIEVANVSPPPPPPDIQVPSDCFRITIQGMGIDWTRTFVPVKELSPTGKTLKGIMDSAVNGMVRALSAGEFETILLDVLRTLQ